MRKSTFKFKHLDPHDAIRHNETFSDCCLIHVFPKGAHHGIRAYPKGQASYFSSESPYGILRALYFSLLGS